MEAVIAEGWSEFFVAGAGALAALAGLVFVALSINMTRILASVGLANRAGEALLLLVGALIQSMLCLVPHQPAFWLGMELLAIGLLLWVFASIIEVRNFSRLREQPLASKLSGFLCSQIATLSYMVAGGMLLAGMAGGLYWLVPGIVFCIFTGVYIAWILLVEILR